MRILSSVLGLLLAGQGLARAEDPHAAMRAAMLAQIDAHPAPATPGRPIQPPIRFVGSHGATGIANSDAHAAAGNGGNGNGNANGMAHQAQAAAASAAGQAQAQAAKTRTKNHPHPTH